MNKEIIRLLEDIFHFIEDEYSFVTHIKLDSKKFGLLRTLTRKDLEWYVQSMDKPKYMLHNKFVRELCNE